MLKFQVLVSSNMLNVKFSQIYGIMVHVYLWEEAHFCLDIFKVINTCSDKII